MAKHSYGRPSYNLISLGTYPHFLSYFLYLILGNISSVKKLLSIVEDELEMSGPRSRSPTGSTPSSLSDHHRRTRMRLLPLLSMETNLTRQLLPEHYDPSRTPEICVRAGSGWKTVLERVTLERRVPPTGQRRPMTNDGRSKDDPTLVLAASKNDIISLWEDESVREVLKRRGVRLEDSPGFFLTDTARIATVDYEPTEGLLHP